MRSIRQNVLPAPGPARTRTGSEGASIASCCESDGESGGTGGGRATTVSPSPRVTVTLVPLLDRDGLPYRKLACVPQPLGDPAEGGSKGVVDLLFRGHGIRFSALSAEKRYLEQRQRIDIRISEGDCILEDAIVVEQRFLAADAQQRGYGALEFCRQRREECLVPTQIINVGAGNLDIRFSAHHIDFRQQVVEERPLLRHRDRKSTRLNSSHLVTSYAVFCLKK